MGAEESIGLSQFLDFQKRPSWGRFVTSLVSFEGFLLVLESQLGRNFISTCFRKYHWLLNECHTTPCAWEPPWYKPLRLEQWHLLYHHPPLNSTAQFFMEYTSLSLSCVVNIMFLKKQRLWVKDNSPCNKNNRDTKTLFTWSGGPRSSGVGFFCFVFPRAWKQKKPTPLDRGPPLHVNRP